MPRKPEAPKPTSWNIYKVDQKAILLGAFKAPNKRAAIEKAARGVQSRRLAPVRGAAAMMQSGAEAPPHCRHANSAPFASSSLLR
jgi:hypothetical protein